MTQNLKLPLYPKCGDTKFVVDNDITLVVKMSQPYRCTQCNIEWDEDRLLEWDSGRILDEFGVEHNLKW